MNKYKQKCERCDEPRACGYYCKRHHEEVCVPQLPHVLRAREEAAAKQAAGKKDC